MSQGTPKIVIAGAGPAGSSLAIRLAKNGFGVTLIERETFPRQKLCGEFISPECFRHFDDLGVTDMLFASGGAHVTETRFFGKSGRSVAVPTNWFGSGEFALSLSRAEMDWHLLKRARSLGVEVFENARVIGVETDDGRLCRLNLRSGNGIRFAIAGDVFVDATGRSAALSKLASKTIDHALVNAKPRRAALLGFKNHFSGVDLPRGVCEIYFFDGGYGGLTHIEGGNANFCFLIKASAAREFIGKTNKLFARLRFQNRRASDTLESAVPVRDWIAVPVDGFGEKAAAPLSNLFTVGDAATFIDPFTGSGILMALESAELLAGCVGEFTHNMSSLGSKYRDTHRRLFEKRLRVSSLLRGAAFVPTAASAAIFAAGLSPRLREFLAKGTRSRKPVIDTCR